MDAHQLAKAARAAEEDFAMNVLRSMTVLTVASGLILGAASAAWSQQGNQGNRTPDTSGTGPNNPTTVSGPMQADAAQASGRNSSQQPQTSMPGINEDLSRDSRDAREGRAGSKLSEPALEEIRNGERQKKLIADTEKLVALVNELKSDVDKSNKNMLSLDVIRKADEIEKLARSVKEKMKGT
jgi:hypothetical protein